MNILIIEDESLVSKKLYKLVMELEPSAEIPAVTTSITSTVNWLQNNPHPDLILMDIELADGQSFDIFKQVDIKSPVIFTTAYDEFALKAFKVNSIDYLLKPVKSDDLQVAFKKFHARSSAATATAPGTLLDYDELLNAIKKLPAAKKFQRPFPC